jgi:hypothetical protein
MERYQIYLYGSELSSRVIGLKDDNLLALQGDNQVVIGSNVVKTRKGFYYCDLFFKKQFVSWSSLKLLN